MSSLSLETLKSSFEPEKYKDEVRERVLELIDRKIAGEDITAIPAEAPQTQIIDLMAALRASIAKAEGEQKPAARKPAKRAEKPKEAPSVEKPSRSRKRAAS